MLLRVLEGCGNHLPAVGPTDASVEVEVGLIVWRPPVVEKDTSLIAKELRDPVAGIHKTEQP